MHLPCNPFAGISEYVALLMARRKEGLASTLQCSLLKDLTNTYWCTDMPLKDSAGMCFLPKTGERKQRERSQSGQDRSDRAYNKHP